MKKYILLSVVGLIALTGCTVVVSEPGSRYVVREVGYQGSHPVEVYYSDGYYYYAPCNGVSSSYYHTRVSYYNSSSMRIVRYERPRNTVIIKEAAPVRTNTVIIKEPAPVRTNTVIIKEPAPVKSNTVIIKEKSPERRPQTNSLPSKAHNGPNQVIIKKKVEEKDKK